MAGTIIDQLIVTLGLDAAKFTAGQKQAAAAMLQTRTTAERTAKDIEARGKQAAEFFSQMRRQVVGLVGAYLSLSGAMRWADRMTTADAALGRSSENIGANRSELLAWQLTADRLGGSGDGLTAMFKQISGEIAEFSISGRSQLIPFLTQIGINFEQFKRAGWTDRILMLNKALTGLGDRQRALRILQDHGYSEETGNLLLTDPAKLTSTLDAMRKFAQVSKEDTDAAIARKNAWADFIATLDNDFRPILTDLTPLIEAILLPMSNWVHANKDWINTKIHEAIAWARDNVDLLKASVELLLLFWVGSKFLAALRAIEAMAAAVWGINAAALATIATLMRLFPLVAPLLLLGGAGGEDPEFSEQKNRELLEQQRQDRANGVVSFSDWLRSFFPESWGGRPLPSSPNKTSDNDPSYVMGPLAALIARGEAGAADYNAVNRGAAGGYASGMENLAGMTLAQVMQAQAGHQFGAAGRYQIMPSTLREAVAGLGLSGNERFNKTTQDRIFEQYLMGVKRKEVGDYIHGRSNDIGGAILGMSKEFASVANPQTGQSYYAGIGNNRASISAAEMRASLENARDLATRSRYRTSQAGSTFGASTQVSINGPITVNDARDADHTARSLRHALRKNFAYANSANYGLA